MLDIKRSNQKIRLFSEISEYPDYYLSQNIPFRHRYKLKLNMDFFENNINEFAGLALMTKSIVEYYKNDHYVKNVVKQRFQMNQSPP